MPQSDPLQILLTHDHWATTQLLSACANLTADQFHQPFEIGPGSLHDTLTHIIGAMRAWSDTLAQTPMRPRLETDGQKRAPAQLQSQLDEASREFAAHVQSHPLSHQVTRTLKDGRTLTLTRGAIATHVTTHGMHHRAQCLNMLRRLNITALPPSSVLEWTWLGDGRA